MKLFHILSVYRMEWASVCMVSRQNTLGFWHGRSSGTPTQMLPRFSWMLHSFWVKVTYLQKLSILLCSCGCTIQKRVLAAVVGFPTLGYWIVHNWHICRLAPPLYRMQKKHRIRTFQFLAAQSRQEQVSADSEVPKLLISPQGLPILVDSAWFSQCSEPRRFRNI